MYGKETGRKEGRRNQIENRQYVEVIYCKLKFLEFCLIYFDLSYFTFYTFFG